MQEIRLLFTLERSSAPRTGTIRGAPTDGSVHGGKWSCRYWHRAHLTGFYQLLCWNSMPSKTVIWYTRKIRALLAEVRRDEDRTKLIHLNRTMFDMFVDKRKSYWLGACNWRITRWQWSQHVKNSVVDFVRWHRTVVGWFPILFKIPGAI